MLSPGVRKVSRARRFLLFSRGGCTSVIVSDRTEAERYRAAPVEGRGLEEKMALPADGDRCLRCHISRRWFFKCGCFSDL